MPAMVGYLNHWATAALFHNKSRILKTLKMITVQLKGGYRMLIYEVFHVILRLIRELNMLFMKEEAAGPFFPVFQNGLSLYILRIGCSPLTPRITLGVPARRR
ncbi:hypothetical protein TNCV_454181 [Trichonephila clavipes]|nr:hypothetical protein TNCV_454181 [Trichonephila clavipes]